MANLSNFLKEPGYRYCMSWILVFAHVAARAATTYWIALKLLQLV